MAIINSNPGHDTLTGTLATDDTYNITVVMSGNTVVSASGDDTLINNDGTGAGFDTVNFNGLSMDFIYAKRIGNDFKLEILPTSQWERRGPHGHAGGHPAAEGLLHRQPWQPGRQDSSSSTAM